MEQQWSGGKHRTYTSIPITESADSITSMSSPTNNAQSLPAGELSALFTQLQLGPLTLRNRFIMAPVTRDRSLVPTNVPSDLMTKYYRQRAQGGAASLIIAESTLSCYSTRVSVLRLSLKLVCRLTLNDLPLQHSLASRPRYMVRRTSPCLEKDYRRCS
jgi:hypothetical protein